MAELRTPGTMRDMQTPRRILLGLIFSWVLVLVCSLVGRVLPASALAPSGLEIRVGSGVAGAAVSVEVTVAPTPGQGRMGSLPVHVQRSTAQGWVTLTRGRTDAAGRMATQFVLARQPEKNRVRARTEGSTPGEWGEAQALLVPESSVVTVAVPATVVDERSIVVRATWHTESGEPVAGTVHLERSVLRSGRWSGWSRFRVLSTDDSGAATVRLRPRHTHRWRAVAVPQPWVATASSQVATTHNLPAGKVVRLPRGAPKPRVSLSPQRRAVGAGARVKVRRISAARWRAMKGVAWRPGCPVGRSDLRVIETNYWAFDGYRRRGEVVVSRRVVDNFRGAFADLHRAKVPIRSLRPVERFGYSARVAGGNDLRSMAAGNSSAFNCRGVVGQPGRRSPHSWGRSFDLNPWENPFRSAWGVVPNRWWLSRSHPDVAWRTQQHRVVKLMARNGFRWTYGHGDLHHFDAT